MAKIVEPAPKYLPSEWVISNQMRGANTESERIAAERLISETLRAIHDTHRNMLDLKEQSDKRLEQRIGDVKHWKREGELYLEYAKEQTDALVAFVARLDKALAAHRETLHITKHCLVTRTKRRGIELVHDKCEKELLKEVEVVEGALALLQRSKEQAVEQLRLNRKTQYNLEQDLKTKTLALGLDEHCRELNDRSHGNKMGDSTPVISPQSVSVDEWMGLSQGYIRAAEKVRQQTEHLRSVLDEMIQCLTHDIQRQVNCTDISFEERIAEVRDAKATLEDHLRHVRHEIIEVEDNIDRIKVALDEAPAALRLAHTRLDHRNHRPGAEMTRDTAQFSLVEEIESLEAGIHSLEERLHHSECSLRGLDRKRLELEADIEIKTLCLYTDEVECMGMRKSISVKCW